MLQIQTAAIVGKLYLASGPRKLVPCSIAISKLTLGLSLPLLVPPLTGAAGASGIEPFNPRRRAMKAEEYNNVLHISSAV